MENKYYTPTIEEFHVGFEYEYRKKGTEWKNNEDDEVICDLECDDIYSLKLDLKNNLIRVKYLDKDDVKECGWKHDANDDGEEIPSLFEKHGYSLGFSIDQQMTPKDICYILYLFPDNFVIVDSIYKCGSGREEMLFRGTIKNKSELKKLMKQLNIQP